MRRRVLFVAPYLPRPDALHAGGVDSAFNLQSLLERCDVDVICLGTMADRRETRDIWPGVRRIECIPYRRSFREKMAGALEDMPSPSRWGRGARFRFREAVRNRIAGTRHDILLVEHQETDLWIDAESVAVRLLDLHDVVSGLLERGTSANPAPERLADVDAARRHEAGLLRRYHGVFVRSEAERKRLAALGDPDRIAILRHPVDIASRRNPRSRRIPGRILLTGSFTRPANQAAARELVGSILPHVLAECPEASVLIVGAGADETLADLARGARVRVMGVVPDLGPAYEESMVFVNPLRCGGGVITRHLESLACGLPVVTVPAGAEGLDTARGYETAETAEDLAALTLRLLNDAGHWDACSRTGCDAVRMHHTPKAVQDVLYGMLDRAVEAARGD